MKRAFPILIPLAAIVIAGATWWRASIDDALPRGRSGSDVMRLPAPRFELFDQHRNMVKIDRYFSRSAILLVFFPPTDDVTQNELLMLLSEHFDEIEARNVVVVGVTTLTPATLNQQTTARGHEFPFPLVSDIYLNNPHPAPVHEVYGLYDAETQRTREGVFYIDRQGIVNSTVTTPVPLDDPAAFITALIAGEEIDE